MHRRNSLRILLGLGLLATWHLALAAAPALYGENYYRLGQSWSDGMPPGPVTPPGEYSDDSARDYLEQTDVLRCVGLFQVEES